MLGDIIICSTLYHIHVVLARPLPSSSWPLRCLSLLAPCISVRLLYHCGAWRYTQYEVLIDIMFMIIERKNRIICQLETIRSTTNYYRSKEEEWPQCTEERGVATHLNSEILRN